VLVVVQNQPGSLLKVNSGDPEVVATILTWNQLQRDHEMTIGLEEEVEITAKLQANSMIGVEVVPVLIARRLRQMWTLMIGVLQGGVARANLTHLQAPLVDLTIGVGEELIPSPGVPLLLEMTGEVELH
jgi:hypothetical protein